MVGKPEVALLVVVLLFSGCMVRIEEHSSQTIERSSRSVTVFNGANCASLKGNASAPPQDIEIRFARDLTGPFDQTWTWKVENTNYTKFRVKMWTEGLSGAPYVASDGSGARLVATSPCGDSNINMNSGGGMRVGSPGTLVNQDSGFAGNWSLRYHAQAALLRLHVEVLVDYP